MSDAPMTLRLSASDNIVVAVRSLPAGTRVDGLTLSSDIGVGHKIAAVAIPKGTKIIKWGFPIGSATCDIAAGDHVHTHNLQSDYLPTFTHDADHLFMETKR